MDKNTVIGLVLMGLIFVGYVWYSSDQAAEYNAAQEKARKEQMQRQADEAAEAAAILAATDSLYAANTVIDSIAGEVIVDSTAVAQPKVNLDEVRYGQTLAAAIEKEVETFEVKNDYLTVEFTTKGGMMSKVTLNEYTKYAEGQRDQKVVLYDPKGARYSTVFDIMNGQNRVPVNTSYFVFDNMGVEKGKDFQKVVMSLEVMPGAYIQYEYVIYDKKKPSRDYLIDFNVKLVNMDAVMAHQSYITVQWKNTSYQNERGFKNENNYTTIAYRLADDDDVEELSMSEGSEAETLKEDPISWVAFKQQFFSQTFIAHDNFSEARVRFETAKPGSGYIKTFSASMRLPYEGQNEYKMSMYCGPNKYSILKDVVDNKGNDLYLEEIIPMGGWLIGWFNRWIIIPVMNFLSNYIASFGIIILILTLLVKALIFPLTYKSYLSTAKMRVIKPEMDALNEKYPRKEDALKKNQAMMELYQKAGVNPLGGCLPMLIQLPILWALFRFFPASIELRGQSFLWADDLSSYDSVLELPFTIPWYGDHVSLFALLMSLALMGFSYMSYKQTGAAQPQMGVMKFMMVYLMPIMMLLWFNDYASGLCYYYLVSQIITMIIMYAMRHFVDDQKIRSMIERNAAKQHNGKKSKFQLRYEEMMRQQEAMQQKKAKR